MTIDEWIAGRDSSPPPELLVCVRAALGARTSAPVTVAAEVCLAAAEEQLRQLLATGCDKRERALDLLTVDALVTYAFEAASDHPESLSERAGMAMQGLALLGVTAAKA